MRKQSLLYVAGAVLVSVLGYAYMRPSKPSKTISDLQQQTKPTAVATADKVADDDKDNPAFAKNQQLVDSYTKEIAAGNLKDGDTYYQRGLVYLKMRYLRAAIADFSAALKLVPDSANAFYSRALAYQQEQRFDEAILDLNEAIKYKADFAAAYNLRGLIYVEQNNFRDAQADYETAIKVNPDFDLAYFNLGTLYARQKNYQAAKEAFLTAIKINQQPAEDATEDDRAAAKSRLAITYLNLANVEFAMDDLPNALKTIDYLIENDPTNVEAYKLRADIYDRQGNTAGATNDRATADNLQLQNMLNSR